jgi:HSP20 family molecular chaperone IbpA
MADNVWISGLYPMNHFAWPEPVSDRVKVLLGEGKLTVEVEVPGFKKGELKVELVDGKLTIKGRKGEREVKHLVRLKRHWVNPLATLEDGLLTIVFTLSDEAKGTSIQIK